MMKEKNSGYLLNNNIYNLCNTLYNMFENWMENNPNNDMHYGTNQNL